MKAKFNITIFHNGDMDILHRSIYEELWKDYCCFKKRVVHLDDKGTQKSHYLARRYERAALLSLFAFFEGVVDYWMGAIGRENADYAGLEQADLSEKCRQILRYCFLQSYTKAQYDFATLYGYIDRFERHDLALLEYVDSEALDAMEGEMETYFCFVETMTGLQRFPQPDASTDNLVQSIGTIVKEARQ